MIFIELDDLTNKLGKDTLLQLTDNDVTILDKIELEAISIIKEYLSNTYDIDKEILNIPKNMALANYICYIMIYSFYQQIPDEDIPARVIKNYDDTMIILAELSKGKRQSNFAKYLSSENLPKTIFRWTSEPKRTH